ncbi:hypothetical protein A3A38_03540 [Candidatus Kaiserbacteria bacterium RIFCSPLOWO2_01_FULL_53_17]|uniref:Uncharacterized protein n=1 Tax=Candidatus Kaiserbacteria bacterium RIFCSPLOWO2_01_FULL_53_17 TaxID=1798511 RepID=A0A1F6EGK4_9BACT|nr:MAG: hypothetical protein A3A38_03540 [Candidatus Kaiserbacteria bacterium RIFCSPLOWO2_01_FULL_53_17]
MEAGQKLVVKKLSFWSGTREIFDGSGARIGTFRVISPWSYRTAEGESGGTKLVFSNSGWNTWKSEAKDETGRVVGRIERKGWCGNKARIMLYEKEYLWRLSTWGTHFWIEGDGKEIVRVSGCGGFGWEGKATFSQSLDTNEAVMLICLGLYQMRLFEMEVSASTAVVAGGVAVSI